MQLWSTLALALGDPHSRQGGFWSCLDTRSAVFIFWALSNLISSILLISSRTHLQQILENLRVLSFGQNLCTGSHCLKEEDLLSVLKYGKVSPVYLKIDSTLTHTHKVRAVLFEYGHYKPPSLAPSIAPPQTWWAKPQQFLQVQFLTVWNAAGSGICDLIAVVSACHICTNGCVCLAGLCSSWAKETLGDLI